MANQFSRKDKARNASSVSFSHRASMGMELPVRGPDNCPHVPARALQWAVDLWPARPDGPDVSDGRNSAVADVLGPDGLLWPRIRPAAEHQAAYFQLPSTPTHLDSSSLRLRPFPAEPREPNIRFLAPDTVFSMIEGFAPLNTPKNSLLCVVHAFACMRMCSCM